MIRCTDIHVTFNRGLPTEKRALRGVSVDIPQGEFVTVIGSNGAGKSTLLNAVAGEISVSAGRVVIDDTDVTDWPTHKRAGRVARVFQDPLAGTCGDLTVEENLALAYGRGRRRGLGQALNDDVRAIFREQLKHLDLGLEDRLKATMGLLSGGQRQSVSLLMAALQPSRILLLDEHTAALDPKTAAMIMDLTDRIVHEQGLTAMMVTHSMRQALDHGTRTLMLHEGQIVLDIQGDDRKDMTVEDLLAMFSRVRQEQLDDDALLLG